jgi:hypothetical protein
VLDKDVVQVIEQSPKAHGAGAVEYYSLPSISFPAATGDDLHYVLRPILFSKLGLTLALGLW